MSVKEFQVKNECDDSNSYNPEYKDEEKNELSQSNDSIGELTTIKTSNGDTTTLYLRLGNRLLFCSGKYFYIERTVDETNYQKEFTGIITTCHTCGVQIRGSLKVSSNFISHLKARHPEVYKDFLKQKQQTGGVATTRRTIHRVSPYPSNSQTANNTVQHQEHQEHQELFQRNVLQFLVATNQSLSLTGNENFRKLFQFPEFSAPLKTPLQYEQIMKGDCKYKQAHLANYFTNTDTYICLSSDVWHFGEYKYIAISCHWIDEDYQRQKILLACIRSSILGGKCPQTIQNEVLLQYGFQKDYIVNTVTQNIQNYMADFIEFGINSEALSLDDLAQAGDCTLSNLIKENLKLIEFNNAAAVNVLQLDTLRLNKIWGGGFAQYCNVKTRRIHLACMEKCSAIWKVCHTLHFKNTFCNILSASLTRPNLFSFSSLYNSLKQLHLNKNRLSQICVFLEKPSFTDVELVYLEELVEIFEPLNAAFDFLDLPQNHFYGCLLPTLVTLKWKLTRLYNSKKLRHLQEFLMKLKDQLLTEFKLYYELDDAKSDAILAAITYPPVKTRFLVGLRDLVACGNFQARNLLLKYGKDFHVDEDALSDANVMVAKQENNTDTLTSATDFFDFGDGTENIPGDNVAPNSLKLEIDTYLADSDNTLSSLQKYPTIKQMFFRYNTCIPSPTSVLLLSIQNILRTSLLSDCTDKQFESYIFYKIDAEELRDVNISKKELSELLAEIYDGLMAEGLSMDSIDLETPRKFLLSYQDDDKFDTPNTLPDRSKSNLNVSRQLGFENNQELCQNVAEAQTKANSIITTNKINMQHVSEIQTECHQITSTNDQNDCTFQPGIMSTPCSHSKKNTNDNNNSFDVCSNQNSDSMALIPIAHLDDNVECSNNKTIVVDSNALNTQLELIAVPIPGQPNCFQLAKVVDNKDILKASENILTEKTARNNSYISVKRNIIAEYIDKFKTLQHAQDSKISSTTTEITDASHQNTNAGFTQYQYDLMQQQLRIHVQQLTQNFVQTYCHPELWKLAPKSKELLLDLEEKANGNVNLKVWNLKPAVELILNWQNELDQDTPENTQLMDFLNHENFDANHQYRRIPRFHPRILECYLNSPVFMYPQYLPRLPFSTKAAIPIFSPVEAYLIAMGLEKHLKKIYEQKEKISKTTPLRAACKRLAKDTVCGKPYRRIWGHIKYLQNVDYYNPIKYFFEHNRAPPVEHDPIWTFHNHVVLPPKDRIHELPLVYQKYLQKKNEELETKVNIKSHKRSRLKTSEAFKNSYLEFVQEAVGQDLPTPNFFYDPAAATDKAISDADSNNTLAGKRIKHSSSKSAVKKKLPQSLTINVNYVYGSGLEISTTSTNTTSAKLPVPLSNVSYSPENTSIGNNNLVNGRIVTDSPNNTFNARSNILDDTTLNGTIDLDRSSLKNTTTNSDCPVVTYNFDWRSKTLQPVADVTQPSLNLQPPFPPVSIKSDVSTPCSVKDKSNKPKTYKKVYRPIKLHKKIKQRSLAYREKRHLKRRCEELITAYSLHLDKIVYIYKTNPFIQYYYSRFKALELYTYLLKGLKATCFITSADMSNNSPSLKRTRYSNSNTEDDNSPTSTTRQVRKLNRQEENFRHMLVPDTPEETNRKDAIYAFNFYEKVEEAFKNANKPDDCKKFNSILKSFDPKKDKVSDLYYKLEKLFLPDHPELAQVFLTFLLPPEAAEIGKFFEHFMINNMSTFINKLNVYFNKQPAQIRKVYNCISDLAEDPDVTMKKVETKIVPLLKGNQFLIDWFMQQFPQNMPPERLFSKPEHINLKDQQCNRSGEYVETLTDLMDSPTIDAQQQQSCQLRYINGRIFYGSKMLLPAKLTFMAASYKHKIQTNEPSDTTSSTSIACVHGIRDYGEKRLQAAADLTSAHINAIEHSTTDDHDKSEEEDVSRTLVIDTTAEEEDSCSSVELCDEGTLKAHATRLNPSVYSSACYSAINPNLMNNFQGHHVNAKKTFLNFNEESKLSPRKNSTSSAISSHLNMQSPISVSSSPITSKERRKSPSKKRSPLTNSNKSMRTNNVAVQPMVVIHETNSAIQCAKRLKSLIEGEGQQTESTEEIIDSKEILKIVAKSKNSLRSSEVLPPVQLCDDVKEEKTEDLEFIPEHSALSPSPFPCLRMETDSNEEDAYNTKSSTTSPPPPLPPPPPSTQSTAAASDEDCKTEIATTLTVDGKENTSTTAVLPLNAAWTRDEDKIVLIEMKIGSQSREELFERISEKLPKRTMFEIKSRHEFLMDFLAKLQGK